jgi:hypothetical protein
VYAPNLISGTRFTLKDSGLFLLPGNAHMLHLASIGYGMREFIVMLNRNTHKVYIEEVVLETKDFSKDVWANLKFIEDDSLANDLAAFCEEKGVIDMKKVTDQLITQGKRQWIQPIR